MFVILIVMGRQQSYCLSLFSLCILGLQGSFHKSQSRVMDSHGTSTQCHDNWPRTSWVRKQAPHVLKRPFANDSLRTCHTLMHEYMHQTCAVSRYFYASTRQGGQTLSLHSCLGNDENHFPCQGSKSMRWNTGVGFGPASVSENNFKTRTTCTKNIQKLSSS